MDINQIEKIVEIIEKSNINCLNIEKGDFKLNYSKNGYENIELNKNINEELTISNDINPHVLEQPIEESKNDIHYIKSPMIGAFYLRPNPDSDPFVEVGSKVSKGDNVCVLEAMKLLNDVQSDVSGEILEILAEDGDIIEFGQPLFKIKVSEFDD